VKKKKKGEKNVLANMIPRILNPKPVRVRGRAAKEEA